MEKGNFNITTSGALNMPVPFIPLLPPSVEELLKQKPEELAYKIIAQKIEIEEQNEGLKILKTTLKEMKEKNKNMGLYHQKILNRVNFEAEMMVQRHQKLIKQLLQEKKELNKIMSQVADHFKLEEIRFTKILKDVEKKHQIEIKRIKEIQMVADKMKREKWMETKIKKIKEMTVKGLEPELSRLASNQQKEMSDLRHLHKIELEAVELKAARRTTELMHTLRAELEKEKNNVIEKEMNIFQNRLEKDFEHERRKLQDIQEKLIEQLKEEEQKLINKEKEFRQNFSDYKEKVEEDKQKMLKKFRYKLLETKTQYIAEINNFKEMLQNEKEIWMNNFKRQETEKFMEKEKELHQKYKKERDRDIEVIIDIFEKESTQIKTKLHEVTESKMIRLKEKLEKEMKETETNETLLKNKLAEAKSEIIAKDNKIRELKSQVGLLKAELVFFKQCSEKLTAEKNKLKDTIKQNFEKTISELLKEKQCLEKELLILKSNLKNSMKKEQIDEEMKEKIQAEMNCVINRLHMALNKKETAIQLLRQKHENIETRCKQLEFLLDNQRVFY